MIVTAILWAVMLPVLVIAGIVAVTISMFTKFNTKQVTATTTMEYKTKGVDFLLYLGVFISLVTSVTNVLEIIFTAIDKKFVDTINTVSNYDYSNDGTRMAIASLVVMFPVYMLLSWYISRDIVRLPFKKELFVRKVMVYAALFVTVLTLIGTLVSAVYTYLGGDLTIRFGLKALTVALVALAVFGYYIYSLRRDYTKKTYIPLVIGLATTFFVLSSVIFSISIIGTPSEMRAKKIDNTRLSDISRIQQEILTRFNATDKIPVNLSELNNAFQGYAVPSDPVTKVPYAYKVIAQPTFKVNLQTNKKELATPAIFELCATFDTVRNLNERGNPVTVAEPVGLATGGVDVMYSANNTYYDGDQSPFWNHEKGEKCFKRIISADMYYGK